LGCQFGLLGRWQSGFKERLCLNCLKGLVKQKVVNMQMNEKENNLMEFGKLVDREIMETEIRRNTTVEQCDKIGFVRNVMTPKGWVQISINTQDIAEIQKILGSVHTAIFNDCFNNAHFILNQKMTKPTNRMIHDLAMKMFEKEAIHASMVWNAFLEKKAKKLRDKISQEMISKNNNTVNQKNEAQTGMDVVKV